MATNTSEQTLDINTQLQEMIKAIDAMNDTLIQEAATAVEEAGDIIMAEQKRIMSTENSKIANLIHRSKLYITKNKHRYTVSTGYSSDAIKSNFECLLYEFGRPGEKRKGTDKLGRKIGVWGKDRVLTTPHIRKGFDSKKDEATKRAIQALDTAIKEFTK